MKFKFFNSDGSANGDKVVDNFPNLDEGKGVDALKAVDHRGTCESKTGKCFYKSSF